MRTWLNASCAAALGVVFMVVLRLPGVSESAINLISNGGQLAAAVLAARGLRGRGPSYDAAPAARLGLAGRGHRRLGRGPGRMELLRGGPRQGRCRSRRWPTSGSWRSRSPPPWGW